VDWLNRVEFFLRQFRKNADNSDVLTYSESIATVKGLLRTFRPHRSRRAKQYTKPLESTYSARTIRYRKPNLVERHPQ
jgi:hypothetical protein